MKQHQAWERLRNTATKYIIFGGGAGGGKSWLGCEWLLTNCYFYPGSKWFIARKELKRLMTSSYVTWGKVCKHHKVPQSDWKLNGQYNFIEFENGSRIDLIDLAYQPKDPLYERLGSLEYTGGWIEEASEVDFLAFDVLKSRIGRHRNKEEKLLPKMLLTCNPTKGWLYREVYKPYRENRLPEDWCFIQSLYSDNPHTSKDYGLSLAEIKDESTKQRLMHGNWEYDDDPAKLIEYEAIQDMFTNTVNEGQRYLVVDVARFGRDLTVFSMWDGMKCYKIETLDKSSTEQVSERIKELAMLNRIPYSQILIDEDGVGGGVVDNLRGVKGFMGNRSPIKTIHDNPKTGYAPNYQNIKSQCAFKLADAINNHQIAVEINDETIRELLVQELEQLKQKDPDKDGKLALIGKDVMKESLGRSPDIADCFIMRMFFELKPVNQFRKSYIPNHAGGYLRR